MIEFKPFHVIDEAPYCLDLVNALSNNKLFKSKGINSAMKQLQQNIDQGKIVFISKKHLNTPRFEPSPDPDSAKYQESACILFPEEFRLKVNLEPLNQLSQLAIAASLANDFVSGKNIGEVESRIAKQLAETFCRDAEKHSLQIIFNHLP